MAGGNQVTLTFAGDSAQLTRAFDQVGASAKSMETEVGTASKSFESVGEGFDKAEERATGFRDTVTGVQDTVAGFGSILKGDFSADALVTAGAGIGDLASGFSNLLVPALGSTLTWLKATKVGLLAQAAVTEVVAAAQWLWNVAMTANPIGIIIVAIGALIAIIVLIATKTTWFQDLWRVVWTWVKDTAVDVWDWLKELPGKIGDVFSSIAGFISAPFRAAFNFIADAWNNTIGQLRWSVPSWVPFIGGNTIAVPQLRKFHTGGIVPGVPGSEMLAVLQAGEHVTPASQTNGPMVLEIRSSGAGVDDLLVQILARAVKQRGGNVQVVLGR